MLFKQAEVFSAWY